MLYNSNVQELLTSLFGERRDAPAESENSIRAEIRRKFQEIRELNEKLCRLGDPARPVNVQGMTSTLNARCGYLKLYATTQQTTRTTDDVDGIGRGFVVEARDAPFFVFNERGTPLMSTLPVNQYGLTVVGNSVAFMMSGHDTWKHVQKDLFGPDGSPRDWLRGKVEVEQPYGHPHCRYVPDEAGSFVGNSDQLCFGDNAAGALLGRTSDEGDLIAAIIALYSWLTEVNVSSPWHARIAPVGLAPGYLHGTVKPACASAVQKVREFVSSPGYQEFVYAARNGELEKMSGIRGEAVGVLGAIPSLENSLVMKQARELMEDGTAILSTTQNAWLSVGMHQLLGAVLELGTNSRWDGAILEAAAESMLVVLGKAWKHHADMRLFDGGRSTRNIMVKYFADWEVMKSGNYY